MNISHISFEHANTLIHEKIQIHHANELIIVRTGYKSSEQCLRDESKIVTQSLLLRSISDQVGDEFMSPKSFGDEIEIVTKSENSCSGIYELI